MVYSLFFSSELLSQHTAAISSESWGTVNQAFFILARMSFSKVTKNVFNSKPNSSAGSPRIPKQHFINISATAFIQNLFSSVITDLIHPSTVVNQFKFWPLSQGQI